MTNSTAKSLCSSGPLEGARIRIYEAPTGSTRQSLLQQHGRLGQNVSSVFHVNCDFDVGGPWAGVGELFSQWIEAIRAARPDLVERHAFELVHVLPVLRRTVEVRNPTLTDLAPNEEKVRNYAADRAFRIVHGLIDLLDSWKQQNDEPWTIICDDYDRAGVIGSRFFVELMRRRAEKLNLYLLLGVAPGAGPSTAQVFDKRAVVNVMQVDLPEESGMIWNSGWALSRAKELESQIGDDRLEKQVHLPEMIRLWNAAGRPEKAVRWRYFGLSFFCNLGFYADALRYGSGLLEDASQYLPEDDHLRWWIIIKTLNANTGMLDADAGLDLAERAQHLAEEETRHLLHQVPDAWVIQLLYLTAMLFARYKKPRDLTRGEEYLDRGLTVIERADISEGERHFQRVFNRNGLAMIRSFQGRHQEALDLCQRGIEELGDYLKADQHRLHRSILNYNIAQVYVATSHYEEALLYFSKAMEMDPNYSEYYNERGNIYLRLGILERALDDYQKAIELSPPYFEVFTNLGQCYRRMGRMVEAAAAYSRALDLDAGHILALLGRANAYESLGEAKLAIADYSAALEKDPTLWDALANRGVLHYELKDIETALVDFDQSIALHGGEPSLLLNRSIVMADLRRFDEAAEGLKAALALGPAPELEEELRAWLTDLAHRRERERVAEAAL